MNRHPWKSRVFLVGLVDVIAGGVVGVLVYLGVDQGVELVHWLVGITNAAIAFLTTVGVLKNGEGETTPVDDPVGRDGLPMMPFRDLEDLHAAADRGDLAVVRDILGERVAA